MPLRCLLFTISLVCLLFGINPVAHSATAQCTNDTVFEIHLIPDSVFARMKGKSFKDNCTVPRADLRYLILSHRDANGNTKRGEMVCNHTIAADLIDIFRKLWVGGYRIERLQLIDDFNADDQLSMEANNTSCFNFRRVANSRKLSKHAQGLAIDMNPFYNPMVVGKRVEPAKAKKWAWNRSGKKNPYLISRDSLPYKLFRQHGFTWGGDWRSKKDYQHFEK